MTCMYPQIELDITLFVNFLIHLAAARGIPVLVHGLDGSSDPNETFVHLKAALAAAGIDRVIVVNISHYGSITERTKQLIQQVTDQYNDFNTTDPLHFIGHSLVSVSAYLDETTFIDMNT
jgi:hypothetical protein